MTRKAVVIDANSNVRLAMVCDGKAGEMFQFYELQQAARLWAAAVSFVHRLLPGGA
jgi:hypothetical protein